MAPQKEIVLATLAVLFTAVALFAVAPEAPEAQNLQGNLKCIARGTILAHGQSWVDKHVPYNQGGTYDGYRTDCSGFVSMCWELARPGLTTSSLGSVSHGISKDELQGGDALLNEGSHVVLFAGWADGARSQYVGM